MNQGKIIIICGPSGVGKGTVIAGLLRQKQIPLTMIPTLTTRDPKPRDETTGHYQYISRDRFLKLLKENKFFETNYYNGNYYGTLADDMKKTISSGIVGIREQDVEHAFFTKKRFPQHAYIIFIDSPLEVIRQRLVKRGEDSEADIAKRLMMGKKELTKKDQCDYIVENLPNDQEHTIQKVLEIIQKVSGI